MKGLIIVMVFFLTVSINFAYAENNFKTSICLVLSPNDLPKDIQSKIKDAFAKDIVLKNLIELNQIAKNLKVLYVNKRY